MEFTELADYPLPSGELTEWTPRVVGDDWAEDLRPLSYLHEDYCFRGSTCRIPEPSDPDRHPGSWLGAVFEIPHPYDPQCVGRALTAWMRRHEVFRTTVTERRDESSAVLTRRLAPGVEVIGHRAGHMRTGTRVHEHLVDLFDRLSPLAWPHCLVATITDNDPGHDSFVLAFGADHSVMDAYSMLLAIGEIQRLYEHELFGTDPELEIAGSHLDFSADERAIGAGVDAEHRAVRAWTEFLRADGGNFPGFPLPLASGSPATSPRPTRRRSQSGTSSWLLSTRQCESINVRARAGGHSMQSAVLAALAITARTVAGTDVTRFVMPMHTRGEARYASSVGWFVGMIPMELDIDGVDSFADCLAAASSAVSANRDLARFPFPRIAELIGIDAAPRFVVSYIDARFIPAASEWSRWGARTLRGAADSDDEVYLWIVRSHKGVSVSARFPSDPVATAGVHRFISAFTAVMARLAAPGCDPARLRATELAAVG